MIVSRTTSLADLRQAMYNNNNVANLKIKALKPNSLKPKPWGANPLNANFRFVNLSEANLIKADSKCEPLYNDRPSIFSSAAKKKKSLKDIKPLKYLANDTGKTRHYAPASQEWFNSIYTYNKNLIKTLPVLNKNLLNLIIFYYFLY